MSCLGERRLLAKHDKTHTAWHRSRYRATPRCKWGVRPALRIHGHAQGGSTRGQSRVSLPLVNATHLARRRSELNPPRAKADPQNGQKTPVASRRSAAVTDAGMRQHPPLGKPARVSDSRRESSVSESEAFSSRAGLCGGNAAVRTHWKTTVTNETGYRRGGLERKKGRGTPSSLQPCSGRGRVCTSIVGKCGLIWLILPVVICLSQRLSHACLSTYSCTVKPRMAH